MQHRELLQNIEELQVRRIAAKRGFLVDASVTAFVSLCLRPCFQAALDAKSASGFERAEALEVAASSLKKEIADSEERLRKQTAAIEELQSELRQRDASILELQCQLKREKSNFNDALEEKERVCRQLERTLAERVRTVWSLP